MLVNQNTSKEEQKQVPYVERLLNGQCTPKGIADETLMEDSPGRGLQ